MKLARWLCAALVVTILLPALAPAQEEKKEANKEEAKKEEKKIEATSEVVLKGLYNPCGVAVQPGTGQVFVSDSGALRIVRMDPTKPGEAADAVTGFTKDVYGKGPMYDIGPLGLAFLEKNQFVVGGGGQPDAEEQVFVYELPEDGKPLAADEAKYKLGPIGPGDQSAKGEGNFYGVAVTPAAIYVTCNGDDTKGWVARAELTDGKPGKLEPYIATKVATEVDAPVGIAINRKGHIVVGQMGEINVPGDSLLTFYSPKTGKMLLNLKTGLNDIAALAYSPKGRLYAVDFAWMDAKQGGLFRLDDDGQGGVATVKVLEFDKPSALAFAPDGTLYVTVFGTAAEGSDEKPGQLLRIKGDL